MPLTTKQRAHLERRLLDDRARALRLLNRDVAENEDSTQQDEAGDLSKVPFHPADRGTDTMNSELEASNETRISREFAEIDAALERLYQRPNEFGVCENTGRDIPFERLDLIPWARTGADPGAAS